MLWRMYINLQILTWLKSTLIILDPRDEILPNDKRRAWQTSQGGYFSFLRIYLYVSLTIMQWMYRVNGWTLPLLEICAREWNKKLILILNKAHLFTILIFKKCFTYYVLCRSHIDKTLLKSWVYKQIKRKTAFCILFHWLELMQKK